MHSGSVGRAVLVLVLLGVAGCATDRASTHDSVRIAVPYEVQTLDPHAESKLWSLSLHSNVYETLVTADAVPVAVTVIVIFPRSASCVRYLPSAPSAFFIIGILGGIWIFPPPTIRPFMRSLPTWHP